MTARTSTHTSAFVSPCRTRGAVLRAPRCRTLATKQAQSVESVDPAHIVEGPWFKATGATTSQRRNEHDLPTDVVESESEYEVILDVPPGTSISEIMVDAHGDEICISVNDVHCSNRNDGLRWLQHERHPHFVCRCLSLPSDADIENTKACLAKGALYVNVPRAASRKGGSTVNKQIKIHQAS